IEGLALIACGGVQVREQDDALATYAPKIDRVAARLDWSRSAADIARHIRAMDPAPGAWTTYSNDTVKLFGASPDDSAGEAGTVLDLEDRMLVAAGSGAVAILDAQPAGRTRMTAAAWCRGAGPKIGERLE
ncbi:MAG: methionyl-tRNA formyltransferase, partial [Gemmatimonadales bacterium]